MYNIIIHTKKPSTIKIIGGIYSPQNSMYASHSLSGRGAEDPIFLSYSQYIKLVINVDLNAGLLAFLI